MFLNAAVEGVVGTEANLEQWLNTWTVRFLKKRENTGIEFSMHKRYVLRMRTHKATVS